MPDAQLHRAGKTLSDSARYRRAKDARNAATLAQWSYANGSWRNADVDDRASQGKIQICGGRSAFGRTENIYGRERPRRTVACHEYRAAASATHHGGASAR